MSDKAVHIEKVLNDLSNSYLAELPARFDELDNLILNLRQTEDYTEHFETLFRYVHSIKGGAGTHNLHIFSTICHDFEDRISEHECNLAVIEKDTIESWLKFVDLLKKAHAIITNHQIDFSTIQDELDALRMHNNNQMFFRCLLVSPTRLQKQICESLLSENDISLSIAGNGYEALGRLLSTKFDFLITNHEISMLNGIALISAIRINNNYNRNILSVLMTSNETLTLNRKSDPDYILIKNENLAENLSIVVSEIIEHLGSPAAQTIN